MSAKTKHVRPLTTFAIEDLYCSTNLEEQIPSEATWSDRQKTHF